MRMTNSMTNCKDSTGQQLKQPTLRFARSCSSTAAPRWRSLPSSGRSKAGIPQSIRTCSLSRSGWFAVGVGLAVLTAMFAYFVNYLDAAITGSKLRIWEHPYVQETYRTRKRNICRNVLFCAALLCAAGSAILYFLGVLSITARQYQTWGSRLFTHLSTCRAATSTWPIRRQGRKLLHIGDEHGGEVRDGTVSRGPSSAVFFDRPVARVPTPRSTPARREARHSIGTSQCESLSAQHPCPGKRRCPGGIRVTVFS